MANEQSGHELPGSKVIDGFFYVRNIGGEICVRELSVRVSEAGEVKAHHGDAVIT
jgi:hypothetical protein